MSWLNASDSFLMDAIARDRIEDLRATVDPVDADSECTRAFAPGLHPTRPAQPRRGLVRLIVWRGPMEVAR